MMGLLKFAHVYTELYMYILKGNLQNIKSAGRDIIMHYNEKSRMKQIIVRIFAERISICLRHRLRKETTVGQRGAPTYFVLNVIFR